MKRQNRNILIAAGSLCMAILIIPTLIVVPFTGSNEASQVQETHATQESAEIKESLSPFSIKVQRSGSGVVEEVPLETYVARVVASEMPVSFELEALKAQALAARTYITKHMAQGEVVSKKVDVTDTTAHQVYKSEKELKKQWQDQYNENITKIKKAVKATAGEIITYNNKPIDASFFSTSNGYTENAEDYWKAEIPYLKSVESPWDQQSPKFEDQKIVTLAGLERTLGIDVPASLLQSTEITKTEGDRVEQVFFGDKAFTGREIREKFGLQSSDFTIQQKGSHVIFTTKGYGHGVGMSQYGANGMAKSGKEYKDIVKHYYQGIEISPLSTQTASLPMDK